MGKKITYIVSNIDKAVFFEHTSLGLRKLGFEVSFILINSQGGALDKFLAENNFLVKHLEVEKISKSLPQVFTCKKYLKEIKPDVVHCHLNPACTVGLSAAFIAGVKTRIYTRHSGLPLQDSAKEKVADKLHNVLATHIVAISQNTKEILLKQGVPESKIFLVHHGFDIDRMSHPDGHEVERIKSVYNQADQYPVIGVVARWLELKGIQYIIPAFKEILSQYPDAKLCLFNANKTAAYFNQIDHLLKKELPSHSFLAVPFEQNVYDLYNLFDVYIHVPVNASCEAFGQTYVESLASGVPGVFTLSGVAREFIVDRRNGLVVPFRDSAAMVKSINELLINADLRKELIQQGKKDVQEMFGLDIYMQKLQNLYNQ